MLLRKLEAKRSTEYTQTCRHTGSHKRPLKHTDIIYSALRFSLEASVDGVMGLKWGGGLTSGIPNMKLSGGTVLVTHAKMHRRIHHRRKSSIRPPPQCMSSEKRGRTRARCLWMWVCVCLRESWYIIRVEYDRWFEANIQRVHVLRPTTRLGSQFGWHSHTVVRN